MQSRLWTIGLIAALGTAPPRAAEVSGIVFDDVNRNGAQDAGEAGIAGVAVSNQDAVATTDARGSFTLPGPGTGVVFVSTPNAYRAVEQFWRPAAGTRPFPFALARVPAGAELTFIH